MLIILKSLIIKTKNKNYFSKISIFTCFLTIFVFSFLITNQIIASEVTGDLSIGILNTKTISDINPTVLQEDVISGYISIGSTSPTSTPNFTFNINYVFTNNETTVLIPTNTVVTKNDGGNLDLTIFSTTNNTTEIKNQLGNVLGSVKIGIPDISLTFSQAITVTIPVGTNYNGQTLTTYYRNEGSTTWNIETTCLVTSGNCTFQTTHATTFATRENPSSPSSQSSSTSNSNSNNSTPSCNDAKPSSTPDLFQINVNSTTAKLFFTPILNTTHFYFSFSTKPNAEDYGAEGNLAREGVQNFTINLLKPNTTYYFKVRGQNGCMPGDWSNIMKITTRPKGVIKSIIFYKKTNIIDKVVSKIVNKTTSIFTPSKNTTILNPKSEPIPTIVTQIKPSISNPPASSPVIIKKRCFLWWCF